MNKRHDGQVGEKLLSERRARAMIGGFPVPRWVVFCEAMLAKRYRVYLREALSTYSKYISVVSNGRKFKVRFSNHRPSSAGFQMGDCDFFVGITQAGIATTEDAIKATIEHMEGKDYS